MVGRPEGAPSSSPTAPLSPALATTPNAPETSAAPLSKWYHSIKRLNHPPLSDGPARSASPISANQARKRASDTEPQQYSCNWARGCGSGCGACCSIHIPSVVPDLSSCHHKIPGRHIIWARTCEIQHGSADTADCVAAACRRSADHQTKTQRRGASTGTDNRRWFRYSTRADDWVWWAVGSNVPIFRRINSTWDRQSDMGRGTWWYIQTDKWLHGLRKRDEHGTCPQLVRLGGHPPPRAFWHWPNHSSLFSRPSSWTYTNINLDAGVLS